MGYTGRLMAQPVITLTEERRRRCTFDLQKPDPPCPNLVRKVIPMFTLTVPFPFLRLALHVELARVVRTRPTSTAPPLSRSELRERLRREVSQHLLRDVGLDDSRSE
jgi:hypothetical protein